MSSLVQPGRTPVARAELVPRPAHEALPGSLVEADVRTHPGVRAADVMTRRPATVHSSASMWTAWGLLHHARVRHAVVVDDHRRPLGVLDDRTIALEWPPGPLGAHRTPVHTLLRGRARPRVRSGDDLGSVARTMLGAEADAVPVVDRDGRLSGLIALWQFAELAAGGGREEPPRGSAARPAEEG